MSTLILVCVFNITAQSSGVLRNHPLTTRENARIEAYQVYADGQCDGGCTEKELDHYSDHKRAMRAKICRESFGHASDLSWIEVRS
jgi:hypothetical protein